MLNEKMAFEQLRNGTLSKKDCELYIDFYMDMKKIWLEKGQIRLFKQAWRKDKMMTKYYIDKFIYGEGMVLA